MMKKQLKEIQLILVKILISLYLVFILPIMYVFLALLVQSLHDWQVELPMLWEKDNRLATANNFIQRLAGVPLKRKK